MKVKFSVNEAAFEKAIKEKFARAIEKTVEGYFDEFVDATPMQTGRTLASWNVSVGAPVALDAGEVGPRTPGTNDMPIGTEPGRTSAEAIANSHKKSAAVYAALVNNPDRKIFITNGADLESDRESELVQERSRAYYMDIGAIPLKIPEFDEPVFDPRGEGMTTIARARFLNKFYTGTYR